MFTLSYNILLNPVSVWLITEPAESPQSAELLQWVNEISILLNEYLNTYFKIIIESIGKNKKWMIRLPPIARNVQ